MFAIVLNLFLLNCFAYTIDEIKKIAIDRSAQLSAHEMELRALDSEMRLSGKWQNPQLMGQFGSLKSGTSQGSTIEMSLTQPIPMSNKFSIKKEMAEVARTQQEKQTIFFKNWIGHQVVLSAWRLSLAYELHLHGLERAKRFLLIKNYIEKRPQVSAKQKVEANLINTNLLQLQKTLDDKNLELNLAMSDLEFWTGLQIKPEELNLVIPDLPKMEFKENLDIHKNLALNLAQGQLTMAELDKSLATKERRPDLFVGGGYRQENMAPINHFSYGIVGINIPLWDTGINRKELANARYKRDQKNYEETYRQIQLKHQKQLETLRYCVNQVKRFPKKYIKTNDDAVKAAEAGFKNGVIDVNTFLLAETQTHEIVDQVFISWMNYLEALSTFQLLNGEDLVWSN